MLTAHDVALTRHKISCREPEVHATKHMLPTADTPSVNGRLARGQLHRLVRSFAQHRTIPEADRENLQHQRCESGTADRVPRPRSPTVHRAHAAARGATRPARPPGLWHSSLAVGMLRRTQFRIPGRAATRRLQTVVSRDLTNHKISCREPTVHGSQHKLSTADTPSVNGTLARGQLHRLVRWLAWPRDGYTCRTRSERHS